MVAVVITPLSLRALWYRYEWQVAKMKINKVTDNLGADSTNNCLSTFFMGSNFFDF